MEIEQNVLVLIHDRVREACIAKYNIEMDYFKIFEDGTISCYYTPSYSYADEESFDIELNDLNPENIDYLISERKRKEKEASDKRLLEQKKSEERKEKIDKENRKSQYLILKKEFENENN